MKSLVIISLLAITFACSNRSKDINAEYEYGYDAGFENDYYSPVSPGDSLLDSFSVPGIPEGDNGNEDSAEYQISAAGSLPGNSDNDSVQPDTLNELENDTLNASANDSETFRLVQDNDLDSGLYYPSVSETGSNFFTTGFNFITFIILVFLVFIIVQLFFLRKKISHTHENTTILKNIAKSQRVTRNIDIIENRLNKIEKNVGQILKDQSKSGNKATSGSKSENRVAGVEKKLPGKEPK